MVAGKVSAFDFSDVSKHAKDLAATAYKKPETPSSGVATLSRDQYETIRYKKERAWWHKEKLPFELEFFHQGGSFVQPTKISEITEENAVKEIKFDPLMFDQGNAKEQIKQLADPHFAGFRVKYNLNSQTVKDEVLEFHGASYLRALGAGQTYGLSARGLAIDTGVSSGEEFPGFVEFWIKRPSAGSKELTIYGLLDSRRATGAYCFTVHPGTETVIDVKARLYLREHIEKLGLAPLTSMYLFGENEHAVREDFRPQVHDSNGLMIQSANGEWLWRPLVNPKHLLMTSFALNNPVGFGLMQRDRKFSDYQDVEDRYDIRPSAWIEPKEGWGHGHIELVQIPSPDETNDNMVAFWTPDKVPEPGHPIDLSYRMRWQQKTDKHPAGLAWVSDTLVGHGYLVKPDDSVEFNVDFEGPNLKKLPPNTQVDCVVTGDANAKVIYTHTQKNPGTDGWRITLRVHRIDKLKPVELRANLRAAGNNVSETWSYILPSE